MKNNGFIQPKIEIEHYTFGVNNFEDKILQPNGDWTNDVPLGEKQFSPRFDTYNCTSFNTLNQIEMYIHNVFNEDLNYSDRWLGIIAGTDPAKGGNDPHTVMEAIRKFGLIPESMLPYTDDLQNVGEYYSFKDANEAECRAEGLKWLEKYDFKHEWVVTPDMAIDEKINNIKTALKYSPLSLSVFAWLTDGRGIYVSIAPPNHWTSMYLYEDFANIFDSYEPWFKKVDQNILFCKRIHIIKKKIEIKLTLWQRIWKWFTEERWIFRILRANSIKI